MSILPRAGARPRLVLTPIGSIACLLLTLHVGRGWLWGFGMAGGTPHCITPRSVAMEKGGCRDTLYLELLVRLSVLERNER